MSPLRSICVAALLAAVPVTFEQNAVALAAASPAAADAPADLPPLPKGAIRLTFLGTGAPRPSDLRSGPSILVEAGPQTFLIDAGSGAREQLYRARGWQMITGLDTIYVTHLHYDHTVDIADLSLTGVASTAGGSP